MRSNRGIFWYSLGLTLLLLLPMVLTVAFFTDQYQKQRQPEAVPENSAVGTHNPHSPSKDYAYSVGRKGRAYTLL